jgi:uncharacterized membrane protein YgcG
MKNFRILSFVLTIATLVLSACGTATATATPAASSAKVNAMPVAFVGIVDSMAGDQWVISGTTVTVDASVVRDGPFNVGDRVKVEGFVNPDGSFAISRVEAPTPQETATLPPLANDNSNNAITNANTNDANINDGNMNDDNSNSANSNDNNSNAANSNDANINDDNSNSANSNDDNSNSTNSNDDNGNDGNSNDDNGGGNSNDDSGGNSGGGGGGNSNDD